MPLDWEKIWLSLCYFNICYKLYFCSFEPELWTSSNSSCSTVPVLHVLESQWTFLRVGSMSPAGATCSPRKPSMSSGSRTCGYPVFVEPRVPISSIIEDCARFVLYFILFEDIFYKTEAIFTWFDPFPTFCSGELLVKWTFSFYFTCFGYFLK